MMRVVLIAFPGRSRLLRRSRMFFLSTRSRRGTTFAAALLGEGMVFSFASAGAGLLAATTLLVDGGPSKTLGFFLGNATIFVAFLDVLGLAFLLVGIG
jgi:hypothetical protein